MHEEQEFRLMDDDLEDKIAVSKLKTMTSIEVLASQIEELDKMVTDDDEESLG